MAGPLETGAVCNIKKRISEAYFEDWKKRWHSFIIFIISIQKSQKRIQSNIQNQISLRQ